MYTLDWREPPSLYNKPIPLYVLLDWVRDTDFGRIAPGVPRSTDTMLVEGPPPPITPRYENIDEVGYPPHARGLSDPSLMMAER